jgi:hypothetical protein
VGGQTGEADVEESRCHTRAAGFVEPWHKGVEQTVIETARQGEDKSADGYAEKHTNMAGLPTGNYSDGGKRDDDDADVGVPAARELGQDETEE